MSRRREPKTPEWLVPAILFSGAVAWFLGTKSAFGSTPKKTGNVQTAIVGDRVYSVTRLGQGHYIVSLISTGGVLEPSPVNFVFSQTEQLGAVGGEEKLAQLKMDMQSFDVNFAS
jgi:hypothetical protein